MSNQPCNIDASALIFKDIHVRGFWLVNWFERSDSALRMAVYGALTKAVAIGTLHAPIDRYFTLDEIAEAAKYSWAGERKGKVMLTPNGI